MCFSPFLTTLNSSDGAHSMLRSKYKSEEVKQRNTVGSRLKKREMVKITSVSSPSLLKLLSAEQRNHVFFSLSHNTK